MFKLLFLPTAEIVKIKRYWISGETSIAGDVMTEYTAQTKRDCLLDLKRFWFYAVKSGEIRMTNAIPEDITTGSKAKGIPKHLIEVIEVTNEL